jgi:hypothetical protein
MRRIEPERFSVNRLKIIFLLAVLVIAITALVVLFGSRPSKERAAQIDNRSERQGGNPAAPVESEEAAATRMDIMPLDGDTLGRFQEANSRAVTVLSRANIGLPYAVVQAEAIRAALVEMGHDPEETLLYWLSPQFQQDLANGDPREIVDRTRLTGNLLSLALGDQASDEEFAGIIAPFSPELQAAASSRRRDSNR